MKNTVIITYYRDADKHNNKWKNIINNKENLSKTMMNEYSDGKWKLFFSVLAK